MPLLEHSTTSMCARSRPVVVSATQAFDLWVFPRAPEAEQSSEAKHRSRLLVELVVRRSAGVGANQNKVLARSPIQKEKRSTLDTFALSSPPRSKLATRSLGPQVPWPLQPLGQYAAAPATRDKARATRATFMMQSGATGEGCGVGLRTFQRGSRARP
eukprot:scaffold40_cov305-Pinguiococcus_pyrenoidosus.AAC.16